MAVGLMPGMGLTAHAETYTTNQNLSTLVLNDILDTTVQSITLTNDKDKKAALKEFHSQQSPVGVKRRTALKFDR